MLAVVKGTESDRVIGILKRIPYRLRKQVQEVTLDLAPTIERIARRSFPMAQLVSDWFHVQQLAGDAVQELRIAHCWEAIDQESKEIELAKEAELPYLPEILENGAVLNSFWPVAGTCFSKTKAIGHPRSYKGRKYSSPAIRIWKKHID